MNRRVVDHICNAVLIAMAIYLIASWIYDWLNSKPISLSILFFAVWFQWLVVIGSTKMLMRHGGK